MVPSAWLVVSRLPLTDSKKVDRRRVRAWLGRLEVTPPRACAPLEPGHGLAHQLSQHVGGLIAHGRHAVAASLADRDFDLVAAGMDSIQVMTLSKWLQHTYKAHLAVETLMRPGLTITALAGLVAACQAGQPPEPDHVDLLSRVDALCSRFTHDAPPRTLALGRVASVLLTGATGFLGIEILHQLLSTHAAHVIVHVRAASAHDGRQRIVDAATQAQWWCSSFHSRLEVWPGDLSSPQLGLDADSWARLVGHSQPRVDAVIHNGAAVQWNRSYRSLEAANTTSTVHLLQALAEREAPARFVYVSGGQMLSPAADDDERMAHAAAHATGYAQSKLVSELVVKRFAARSCANKHVQSDNHRHPDGHQPDE
ncbi:hypothetical protein CDD82_1811 [Ophiocordyceps australis]|uniref:Uncharacterized protein n=1 Tax=Ophiocordyceps australis TaxID=1399860 RepID=A0A2C5XA55_9HYPO|nr:hypothetical protein CDD82_1811 [Ophiocordyceps australis]